MAKFWTYPIFYSELTIYLLPNNSWMHLISDRNISWTDLLYQIWVILLTLWEWDQRNKNKYLKRVHINTWFLNLKEYDKQDIRKLNPKTPQRLQRKHWIFPIACWKRFQKNSKNYNIFQKIPKCSEKFQKILKDSNKYHIAPKESTTFQKTPKEFKRALIRLVH